MLLEFDGQRLSHVDWILLSPKSINQIITSFTLLQTKRIINYFKQKNEK